MNYVILGIEPVDYVSKRTGQQVRGTNLHCVVDGPNSRVQGQQVERLYCKEAIDTSVLHLEDHIEVFYNRFGSVDSVHLI